MIKCISIDGTDGVGKSTLITHLSKKYNIVTLQRFYMTGIAPIDSEERKLWFRSEDVVLTTKIYIAGQKLRMNSAYEFKKGLHYKFLEKDNREKLIFIDRGVLSIQAYTYAALKKGTDWDDNKILKFVHDECVMDDYLNDLIDYSILLFDEESLEEVISRRNYDRDDELLVRYQHDYYRRINFHNKKIRIISPLKSEKNVLEESIDLIERMD